MLLNIPECPGQPHNKGQSAPAVRDAGVEGPGLLAEKDPTCPLQPSPKPPIPQRAVKLTERVGGLTSPSPPF